MSELETKDEILTAGRQLAASIEAQTERCIHALQNREESRRLETLKAKWVTWEQSATAAGIDVIKEFGKEKLELFRPLIVKVSPFQRQRRVLGVPELHAIGSRQPERNQEQTKPSTMSLENWP